MLFFFFGSVIQFRIFTHVLQGGNLEERISTNPFDIPIDTHSDALSMVIRLSMKSAIIHGQTYCKKIKFTQTN